MELSTVKRVELALAIRRVWKNYGEWNIARGELREPHAAACDLARALHVLVRTVRELVPAGRQMTAPELRGVAFLLLDDLVPLAGCRAANVARRPVDPAAPAGDEFDEVSRGVRP